MYLLHLHVLLLASTWPVLDLSCICTPNTAYIYMCITFDVCCRPDYISPLEDLAFDMYQDPEVAGIIRKLERKKQSAVMSESAV